jgi:hypothetical protein
MLERDFLTPRRETGTKKGCICTSSWKYYYECYFIYNQQVARRERFEFPLPLGEGQVRLENPGRTKAIPTIGF